MPSYFLTAKRLTYFNNFCVNSEEEETRDEHLSLSTITPLFHYKGLIVGQGQTSTSGKTGAKYTKRNKP